MPPSTHRKIPNPSKIALAILIAVSSAARADLHWPKETVEIQAKIAQTVLRTAFKFTNTGKKSVSIKSIKPSCGCVATALDKFDYAPGESGEIRVTVDLEMDDSSGPREQTILVTTSDSPKTPTALHLNMNVPETVSVSPELLSWKLGEKPLPKTALVTAGPDIAPIKLTQASANSDFSVQITPKVKGHSYRIKVTPKTTDAPSYAQIELLAESTSFPRPEACKVHANIQ